MLVIIGEDNLRWFSLIFGLFLFTTSLMILYGINWATQTASQYGGSQAGGQIGNALGGVTIATIIVFLIGFVLLVSGFRPKPTKLSIDEIRKLGLTGQQIANASKPPTSTILMQSTAPSLLTAEGVRRFCAHCGTQFMTNAGFCAHCGRSRY